MNCANCKHYIAFAKGCACDIYPEKCPYDNSFPDEALLLNKDTRLNFEQKYDGEH